MIEPESLLIRNIYFHGEQMGSILKLAQPTSTKISVIFTCQWRRIPTDAGIIDKILPAQPYILVVLNLSYNLKIVAAPVSVNAD